MFLQTYRAKLLFTTFLLMLLLGGSLLYTYNYVRDLLFEEDNRYLQRISQVLHSQLEYEKHEYLRYANIVGDDTSVREYMFIIVSIGGEAGSLQNLIQRQFGWLPINRFVAISDKNDIIAGTQQTDLAKVLRDLPGKRKQGTLYLQADHGLEMMAYTSIAYQGHELGKIAISYSLDQAWLQRHQQDTGGTLSLVHNGRIVLASDPALAGQPFEAKNHVVQLGETAYRTRRIDISPSHGDVPQLWFAIKESSILQHLEKYRLTIITIVSLSMVLILLFGIIIVLNFTRPLSRLVRITREVANGKLPHLEKSARQNEITELTNYFADMLQALRDKQAEIERVHAELEQTAITDSLTGLYNRRQLAEVFPKLQAQAWRSKESLYGILIDLDKFKQINETYGYLGGDACLQHFSHLLKDISRSNDYLFRMGGEEFLLLTVAQDAAGILALAEKLRDSMAQTRVEHDNTTIHFTISCGVSKANLDEPPTQSIKHMMRRADAALRRAKAAGRNQVQADESLSNGG